MVDDTYPLITIGITAYNATATIEKALESACTQNWPNIDIIVVDDASSDSTPNKILQFITKYPTIRFIQLPNNLGVAAARNKIIQEAKGELIAFFDDDDVSVPERLQVQYARLIEGEAEALGYPVICHSARLQHYPDGTERYDPTMGMTKNRAIPHGEEVVAHILFNRPIPGGHGAIATCSQMARRIVYQLVGGFDENFRRSEDTEFNLRLALKGGYFVGCAEPLVQQTMTLASDKRLDSERLFTLKIYEKHQKILQEKKRYAFDYAWIEGKYTFLAGQKLHFIIKLGVLFLRHPILTVERLYYAIPSWRYNLAFRTLHQK